MPRALDRRNEDASAMRSFLLRDPSHDGRGRSYLNSRNALAITTSVLPS